MLGLAVATIAVIYFSVYAYRALTIQDLSSLYRPDVILAGILLTLFYALLALVAAFAWSRFLKGLGQPVKFGGAWAILAATQIGKYLPGNFGHHLGRVVVARMRGLNTEKVVLSIIYETLIVLLACAHVSLLTFLWRHFGRTPELPFADNHGWLVVIISMGTIGILLAVPWVAGAVAKLRTEGDSLPLLRSSRRVRWTTTLVCYLLYTASFFLVGAGLLVVASILTDAPLTAANLLLLTGAFASSWILGFITPGAPAGIGVREAVLLAWLGAYFGATAAVSLILILRIATTFGDLINFLWGGLVLARSTRKSSNSTIGP